MKTRITILLAALFVSFNFSFAQQDEECMNILSKGLMAASSKSLILSILMKGESYGYDILQQIKQLSNGELGWSDGMLYPLLQKMTKESLIASEWRVLDNGRNRKYYSITDSGREALKEEKAHWEFMNTMLQLSWKELKIT